MKKAKPHVQSKIAWIGAISAVLVALAGSYFAYKTSIENPTTKIIKKGDCSGDFSGEITGSNINLDCSKAQ